MTDVKTNLYFRRKETDLIFSNCCTNSEVYFRLKSVCENETRVSNTLLRSERTKRSLQTKRDILCHFYHRESSLIVRWKTQIFICGVITSGGNGSSSTIRTDGRAFFIMLPLRHASVVHHCTRWLSTHAFSKTVPVVRVLRAPFARWEFNPSPECRLHIHRSGDNERSRAIFDHGWTPPARRSNGTRVGHSFSIPLTLNPRTTRVTGDYRQKPLNFSPTVAGEQVPHEASSILKLKRVTYSSSSCRAIQFRGETSEFTRGGLSRGLRD